MRQKRAKTYRKLMSLYSMSFGFRQPYQVLVDSEVCKASVDHKIELVKQLGTVLQGEVKPMITQCCIHELYLQRGQQPAVDLAKTFERRKCNHREPIPGDECLASVVGDSNKHRYVIATQSTPLRIKLRLIPAVPIVHINRSVMILEPPSDTTIRAKALMEQKALNSTTSTETALLASLSTSTEPVPKKKRGPKGPNPLSVKKKKKPNPLPQLTKSLDGKDVSSGKQQKGEVKKSDDTHKRKRREDNEGDEATAGSPNIVMNDSTGSPRKRKRRRKGASNTSDSNVIHES
ncbi:Fcf1-domain-containing protein [Lentinula boryana]|uniref:Fcf1-domain-containing protein n=1 Tax=Lentinula boryana TaxID=40481 RepID=A0ABQ8QS46_9AGAR|nr:Fcf1-domain-containing protein [Lentinula boryana]